MLLFWKQGYESTSLNELTQAMGITAPSLYAAFGDKKRLFLAAIERYVGTPMQAEQLIEQAPTAAAAASALLTGAAMAYTGRKTPAGCLLASAAAACSDEAEDIRAVLAAIRNRIERRLKQKIVSDVAKGELPENVNANALAGLTMAVIQGMSTLARDGASRQKLLLVASAAISVWPASDRLPH